MSNIITTANESGEVQEAQETLTVICSFGTKMDEAIAMNEAIVITLKNGNTGYVHECDSAYVTEFEGKNYLKGDTVNVRRGIHSGNRVPTQYAVELYSGDYATTFDEDNIYRTRYSNRKFHVDEMSSEEIVFLNDNASEEDWDNCEYRGNCTTIYDEDGDTFWAYDGYLSNYIYCSDNSRYYTNESACEYEGLIYAESIDEWLTEYTYSHRFCEDGLPKHHNTQAYHYFSRRSRKDSNHCGFSIGLEVEKEDRQVKVNVSADNLYDELGWCKETDGSLDDISGFEAISPVYSLFGKQLQKDLKDKRIIDILNADYSESCGGHINLSSDAFNKHELFEGLSAFLPLLYSLYQNRMNESYCKAKKKSEMAARADKYSAVFIRDNRIEFRIFPAVRSVDNLLWRVELIRIMVKNINATELQVVKMMLNKKSKLHRHLLRIMDEERIQKKCIKFLEYSKAFNDKNIDREGGNLLKLN